MFSARGKHHRWPQQQDIFHLHFATRHPGAKMLGFRHTVLIWLSGCTGRDPLARSPPEVAPYIDRSVSQDATQAWPC